MWEAKIVKKKLNRLLRPGMGIYFVVMMGFCLVALLMDQTVLAAFEGLATAVLYAGYLLVRKLRHRELLRYLEKSPNTIETAGIGENPFPMVTIRLHDGSIVLANDQFTKITGFSDVLTEQYIGDVLPGFSTDWLIDRKTEAPYDATIHGRRYRVTAPP